MRPQLRTTIFLISLGVFLVSLFLYQLTSIARHDFFVAHHFGGLLPRLTTLTYFFSGFLIVLWIVLRRIKTYPVKYLVIITLIGAAVFAGLAIFTHPTRSQDIYWSLLLGKGSTHFNLNPYQTQPMVLASDPWAYPVLTWKDIPMIYGPLWTAVVALATKFTASLAIALLSVKVLFVGLWALAGYFVWKISGEHKLEDLDRAKLLMLFLWNPAVLQIALVDLHNDVFLMVAFLGSYYFLLKKNYWASMLMLIMGALVKYIPGLFLIIPLWYLWHSKLPTQEKYRQTSSALLVGIIATFVLFAPFGGFHLNNFLGLTAQVDRIGLPAVYLPGTNFILSVFHLDYAQLHWFGFILGLLLIVWCLRKNKPLLAYTVPSLAIFFFATSWFQPWYGLWVLPLLMFAWPTIAIVLLSIFLMFLPELITPAELSLSLPAYIFYGWGIKTLWEQIKNR